MNLIHQIILQNFRNYSFRQFEFCHKINFFVGENGVGKTNLLEAISMISISGGIKGADFNDLNKDFSKPFSLGFETTIGKIGIKNNNGVKKFYNEDEGIKFSSLEEKFKIIAMMPEDEFVFRASVSERRKFFDELLGRLSKNHSILLKDYKNLCSQRSKILADFTEQNSWLDVIEKQIAEKLVIIASNRVLLCEKLSSVMKEFESEGLHGEVVITGHLESKILKGDFIASKEEVLLKDELRLSRTIDRITGKTLTKLERTNFDVLFKEKGLLATKCSSGEQKKMLFSFFLAVVKLSECSIILIDEVVDKLDNNGKNLIFAELEKLQKQVFLTGTERLNSVNCNFIFI